MFEFFCYAVAIVAVLAFVGGESTPAPVAEVAAIEDDLPSLPELMAEAEAMTAQPVPAQAATIAAPVAVCRVKADVAVTDYGDMTSAQLRRVCQDRGIRWRNAHAKGRHLSKGEMIAALA